MYYNKFNFWLFAVSVAMLIINGCASEVQKPEKICPSDKTAAELLSSMSMQAENAVPLKANGRCLLKFYTEEGKLKKESFSVKLWLNPPLEIYMQGDIAFNPRGIVLGSNEEEFWLAVKPKEVNGYWWGRWSEISHSEKLLISPRLVLEALGFLAVSDVEKWSLSREGAFDVLTKQGNGGETGRIYIDSCDYLVKKIEYFADEGPAAVVIEMSKYKKISEDFSVPRAVKITNLTDSGKEEFIQISINSVKQAEFTDKTRGRLFTRPEPEGFDHVYEIVGGGIIEQPRENN